ncbi:MAG: HD domain-containing protein [Firmicutes bacterium]|nr:HD domain-containing protein [Bacillota bacterium]MDY6159875.1 HD domain-containing protein [Candidatus Faecousia sp.]
MTLPEQIARCLQMLESAGYAAYLVGGCVRDDLMGISPQDFDLCTAALPEQTAAVFAGIPQDLTGVRHGTVKLLMEGMEVEITTFRREGSYQDNRHPDWVEFVPDIREDLARRDFTVNAIAYSPSRGYVDPFGGRADLQSGILRCVGEPERRFREDALRILRGMRFAARFGFLPEPATQDAMIGLAPLTDALARERVYQELSGFLLKADVPNLLRFAPILAQVIPELSPTLGFLQHSPHHAYDVFTHTAHVTAAVAPVLSLRWAALLHDIGKVPCFSQDENGRGHFKGHAQVSAQMADAVLHRLHAPTQLRETAVWLIDHHMTVLQPEEALLRRSLSRYGRERLELLLCLQEADMKGKGTREHENSQRYPRLREILSQLDAQEGRLTLKSLKINGNDLIALGMTGRQIGDCLNRLLEQVLSGSLENEKSALIQAAKGEK